MSETILTTDGLIPGQRPTFTGKVRDVYDLGENLLIVATDRISTYDCIHPNGIPEKGKILTSMTLAWLKVLTMAKPHHLITSEVSEFPEPFKYYPNILEGRSLLVKKARVIPVECAIRNYLYGSAFREYQKSGMVNGYRLWPNLRQAHKFQNPLFTPATKSFSGHDENMTMIQVITQLGLRLVLELECRTKWINQEASRYAERRGIIIADTKFEFGIGENGQIILIDEVLTPDSTRYWLKELWKPAQVQKAFDKQFVRDFVDSIDWDHCPPAPRLPDEIVCETRERYLEIKKRLFEPLQI